MKTPPILTRVKFPCLYSEVICMSENDNKEIIVNDKASGNEKKNGAKKIIWIILLIIFIAVFLWCGWKIYNKFFVTSENPNEDNKFRSEVSSNTEPEVELVDNPVDFDALHKINPDIFAWIYIPGVEEAYGTAIDYPILQSPADKPEDFYLTHDWEGNPLFDGSVYIQKMNYKDFSDPNTVIYGHDLYNKSMFTPLRKYRNADFFNRNNTIYIYTPGHILTYEIYSAFVYDNRHILNSFDFYNTTDYAEFLAQTLSPSSMVRQVKPGAQVTTDNKIITLSTCTNNKSERYLVVGVLVNDQLTK